MALAREESRRAGRDRRIDQRTQRLYTVLVVADVSAQHEIAGRQGIRMPIEGLTDTSHPHRDWTQPLRVAFRRRSGRFSGRSVRTTRTAPSAAREAGDAGSASQLDDALAGDELPRA